MNRSVRTSFAILLAVVSSTSLCGAALAQDGPTDLLPQYKGQAIIDPEAQIASTLSEYIPDGSVSALNVRIASPAWWTVSRGSRKVYILGVPWLFKPGTDWNKIRLTNRLRDAKYGQVILPPLLKGDAAPSDTSGATPDPQPIPGAYVDRVRKAAAAIGRPAERYLNLSPLSAGYRLTTDFRSSEGLKSELATAEVAEAAAHLSLTPTLAGTLSWPEGAFSVPAPSAGLDCLDAALDEVEAGKAAFEEALEAWASGDVRKALTAPRGLERCSFAFPVQSQIRQDGIKVQVDTIKANLLPGSSASVAVVYLRALLSADGVLARLQAQGYKIEAPQP
jgi:hypothetical protein